MPLLTSTLVDRFPTNRLPALHPKGKSSEDAASKHHARLAGRDLCMVPGENIQWRAKTEPVPAALDAQKRFTKIEPVPAALDAPSQIAKTEPAPAALDAPNRIAKTRPPPTLDVRGRTLMQLPSAIERTKADLDRAISTLQDAQNGRQTAVANSRGELKIGRDTGILNKLLDCLRAVFGRTAAGRWPINKLCDILEHKAERRRISKLYDILEHKAECHLEARLENAPLAMRERGLSAALERVHNRRFFVRERERGKLLTADLIRARIEWNIDTAEVVIRQKDLTNEALNLFGNRTTSSELWQLLKNVRYNTAQSAETMRRFRLQWRALERSIIAREEEIEALTARPYVERTMSDLEYNLKNYEKFLDWNAAEQIRHISAANNMIAWIGDAVKTAAEKQGVLPQPWIPPEPCTE